MSVGVLFLYPLTWGRILATAVDLWDAFGYYFQSIAGAELPPSSVASLPDVDLSPVLPFSVAELERKLNALWDGVFNAQNFAIYNAWVGELATMVSLLLLPVVLLIYSLFLLAHMWLTRETERTGDTKALTAYKRITARPYDAVRGYISDTLDFCATYPVYHKALFWIWLLNLNMLTILGEAIAVYFYFAASFDVPALGTFLVRLLMDMLIMFASAPWPFWVALGWVVLCKIREGIGYTVLETHESHNRDFVNGLPCATMLEGTMGSKKTTGAVDMGISCAIVFRNKALELMLNNDLRFPAFPWAALREDFRRAVMEHEVYNLTTVERWCQLCHYKYHHAPAPDNIWGYDTDRYPTEYSNDLQIFDIWEVITNYCKEFFIYALNGSLIAANFSVREDFDAAEGYFPLWNTDLFRRDPRLQEYQSAYAHILDFDLLRLGKRMAEDAQEHGFLDVGVVLITEIGKERGNQNALKEMKRLVDECNQKNDKFEDYLKMIRHPAVVDNFVFMKIITDDQRSASWAADGRELCTIINIVSCSETKVALPFFTFAHMAYDFFRPRYDAFMVEYSHARRDMCLPVYLYRQIHSFFFARHDRACNRFGYMEEILETENGKQDGEKKEHTYYLAKKKIYSNRFATNCHKGLFTRRALRATVGLADMPTYAATLATDEELDLTHSHFIRAVRKDFDGE